MPYDPTIPNLGYVRVDMIGRIYGQTTVNVFGWNHVGTVGDTTHAQFVAAFETMVTPLLSLLSTDWSGQSYRVYSYDAAGVMQNWTDHLNSTTGGVPSEAVPPNVAMVVKKRSGSPGRDQRGRWYFAGLTRADHLNGEVIAGNRAAFITATEDWDDILPVASENFQPSILTYAVNGNVIGDVDINIVEPSWTLRNMRRRQLGVGI